MYKDMSEEELEDCYSKLTLVAKKVMTSPRFSQTQKKLCEGVEGIV